MKDPVIERKMNQFRDGSLSFNRGIPTYSENRNSLRKMQVTHPSSGKLDFEWAFWG